MGGVSLGAAVAAAWAIAHPGRALAVLAALPPWLGASDAAPAAAAARATAATLRRDGLDATVAELRATSPAWLADELTRSWTRQWPGLPEAMEAAADYTAPTAAQLGTLATPMGVAGSPDDPVHPVSVARQWAAAAPHAALRTVTLTDFGADPSALGATALAALAAVGMTALNAAIGRISSDIAALVAKFDPPTVRMFERAVADLQASIGQILAPVLRNATVLIRGVADTFASLSGPGRLAVAALIGAGVALGVAAVGAASLSALGAFHVIGQLFHDAQRPGFLDAARA